MMAGAGSGWWRKVLRASGLAKPDRGSGSRISFHEHSARNFSTHRATLQRIAQLYRESRNRASWVARFWPRRKVLDGKQLARKLRGQEDRKKTGKLRAVMLAAGGAQSCWRRAAQLPQAAAGAEGIGHG